MLKDMLKNIDIFSTLDDNDLNTIAQISTIKTLRKDNILFYEGDSSNSFYALLEGELKLYKTGIKSQEIVLHYFIKPTLVAEMATLENINFPATAIALCDNTKVAVIDKEKFLKILQNDTKFSLHIIRSLTKKIKNLEVAISRNLIFDATTKVCSFIKEKPEILKTHKSVQIANLLNMAPETLSRTITKLRKLNILDNENNIKDIEKLDMFLDF